MNMNMNLGHSHNLNHLSPAIDTSTSHQHDLQVFRLDDSPLSSSTDVFAVKLTDEIYTALVAAQKNGTKISVKVDEQGNGTWHLGDSVFRFHKQKLEGNCTDSYVYNPLEKAYQSCGSVRTKFQIQATNKSFDATRERTANKLAEVKANATKVVGKKDSQPSHAAHRYLPQHRAVSGTQGSSPFSSSPFHRNSPLPPKTSPKFSSASNHSGATNHGSSSTHSLSHTIDPLRHELQKTPLRKRVIHLIATGQHRTWKEVYTRLEEDGLSDEQKSKSRIESMIGELSDVQQLPNRSPKLALKPSLYNELDMRWKWFNEDEKATVRRLVSSGKAHTSASEEAFAPVRKSHVERIQAGSRGDKQQSRVVSPESIPTPPSGQMGQSGNKQPGPSTGHSASQATTTTSTVDKDPLGAILALSDPVLDSDYTSPTSQNKRKAHIASAAVASSNSAPAAKRPRPESSSPPEDPTIVDKERHVQKQQQVEKEKLPKITVTTSQKKKKQQQQQQPVAPASVSGGSSSSSSSRTQSPAFFSSPPEPSRDWDKVFQEAKTVKEAEDYYTRFCADYPEYMRCYHTLRQITNEFRDFERRYKLAQRQANASQLNAIEKQIQDRFNCLERDEDFIEARRRHSDLRAKLTVLKMRISEWDRTQRHA